MKRIGLVLLGGLLIVPIAVSRARGESGSTRPSLRVQLTAAPPSSSVERDIVIAQVPPSEAEHQVPVKEGVEPPDSPAADMAGDNAEAQVPSAEPPSQVEEPAAQPPDVEEEGDQPPDVGEEGDQPADVEQAPAEP